MLLPPPLKMLLLPPLKILLLPPQKTLLLPPRTLRGQTWRQHYALRLSCLKPAGLGRGTGGEGRGTGGEGGAL